MVLAVMVPNNHAVHFTGSHTVRPTDHFKNDVTFDHQVAAQKEQIGDIPPSTDAMEQ